MKKVKDSLLMAQLAALREAETRLRAVVEADCQELTALRIQLAALREAAAKVCRVRSELLRALDHAGWQDNAELCVLRLEFVEAFAGLQAALDAAGRGG